MSNVLKSVLQRPQRTTSSQSLQDLPCKSSLEFLLKSYLSSICSIELVTSDLAGAVAPPDSLHTRRTLCQKHSKHIILHRAGSVNHFFVKNPKYFNFFFCYPQKTRFSGRLSPDPVHARIQFLGTNHDRMPAGVPLRRDCCQSAPFHFCENCLNRLPLTHLPTAV